MKVEEPEIRWKCNKCGHILKEKPIRYKGELCRTSGGTPYPVGGWSCKNLSCRGGQYFPIDPIFEHAVFASIHSTNKKEAIK